MQNPFSRLKHYRPGENDSKENHATESLAACLALSEDFRRLFLDFLFGGKDKIPPELSDLSRVEVETQRHTVEGKFLDLVLTAPDYDYGLVVEVKVEAIETAAQLDNYERWLQEHFGKSSLFTLVKRDAQFKHRSAQRRFWSDLQERAEQFSKECSSPTDKALAGFFCEYLLREGVVDKMDYTKLIHYGKEKAALRALDALFAETKELVEQSVVDLLEPRNFHPGGCWVPPSFQFGRKSWVKHFGSEGWNNKVYVWFSTSAFDAECPDNCCKIYFVIWLWCNDHGQDWVRTKALIPRWLDHLSCQEGLAGSADKRRQQIPWTSDQAQTLDRQRIYCFWQGKPLSVGIGELQDPERLANVISNRVLKCIELVDGLPVVSSPSETAPK